MSGIEIQLIGALSVVVDGRQVPLPASRKSRALLAVLALEPTTHARTTLCQLIWPETADPRAALRWSLTKLRGALGADAIDAQRDLIRLDPARVGTDVARIADDLGSLGPDAVAALRAREPAFASVPLSGLDGAAGAEFELWLASQQDRLKRLHQQVLGALIDHAPAEEALGLARKRVALDPLNQAANESLLAMIYGTLGRREGQHALEDMRRRFRDEGLSDAALLASWRRMSAEQAAAAPVTAPAPPAPQEANAPVEATTLSLPSRPSLALLGFEPLGAESEILAEGLAVDLTSKLARLRSLFVTARGSALRFSLADHDPATIGRHLGVRYLVHGTAQKLGARIRVTVDLVSVTDGEELWSERFDRSVDDLFAVQDEITDAIIAALEPQLDQAERQRSRLLATEDLGAWELFHRAMWHSFRFTRTDTREAHALLERALRQDPQFARAYAGLSFSYFSRVFLDASRDPDADLMRALDGARESVSLEPRDAFGHWSLGRALFLAGEHDQALSALDRALLANPNYAQGRYARGFVEVHAGLGDQALSDLDMARRLSPFDPLLFAMDSSRAIGLAVNGRVAEAAQWAVRATREPNAHFHIFAVAAACLQLADRHEEAARTAAEVLSLHPGYSVEVFERSFPHKAEHDRRMLSDALQAAGVARARSG